MSNDFDVSLLMSCIRMQLGWNEAGCGWLLHVETLDHETILVTHVGDDGLSIADYEIRVRERMRYK